MSGTHTDYTLTPSLGLYKPNANAAVGFWGDLLNSNADAIDAAIHFASGGGPFLPLAGGSVVGPINVTVTGTPVKRPVQDALADAVSVKSFGAIMDGNSHPLSGVYSSLAAAQAVYPHAVSLADEIDWCAIQGAVNALLPAIYVPAGTAIINRPVVSSTAPITLVGDGQNTSIIVQTSTGQDGWQHTSSQSFQAFDIELRCTAACGTALNLNFAGSATQLTLRGVTISGQTNTTTQYWHDGVRAIGPSRMSISRTLIAGIASAPLSSVGNGIYLAPATTPTVAGSFIMSIEDTIINNYQSAIVLDSTGRAGNTDLQGVVLDWVNSNGCMQFITVLGILLELIVTKCQAQTYGSIIQGNNANTVVVRDSYFILQPSDANAVAGQLPQDVFYINGGGNWTLADNRVVMVGATVLFILNILGSAGGVYVRNNSVYVASGAVASGFMSVASGCHHCIESGTQFSFWNTAWPYFVNANANGGTANGGSFGALGTVGGSAVFAKDQWQNQGAYMAWNYPLASGATALFSSKGGAAGGFNFYNVASDPAQTPVLLGSLLPTATTLLPPTTIMGPGAAGTGTALAAIDGPIGQNRILQFRSAGSPRWNLYADNTAEGGSDAGSNLIIARLHDNGTTIGNALTINRATGQIVAVAGITINNASGCNWTQGVGAPSASATRGSLYSRTDGGVGTTLYVCQGTTTWNPVAGV